MRVSVILPRSMAQGPDIRGEGGELLGSELRTSHGRHGAAVLFGLRHSLLNDLLDSGVAAVAPQPLVGGEVRPQGRTRGMRAVATRTGRAAHFTVVDAIAQRDHLPRGAFGNRKVSRAGVGMGSLRRFGYSFLDLTGGSQWTGAGCVGRRAVARTAFVHDSIDAPADVVGNKQRAVRPTATPEGRCAAPSGVFTAPAKPSAKISQPPAALIAEERLKDYVIAALRVGRAIP